MGLLVVAAVVALALTLLALATVALVQLVLFVTVRNTLLAAAAVGAYWFVDSRRRQVAKGFYSCTGVPGSAEGEATKNPPRASTRRAIREEGKEEEKRDDKTPQQHTNATSGAVPSTATTGTADSSEDAAEQRDSLASNASEAESCTDEVPIAAAAVTASPTSATQQRTTTSPMRLPDLRHRKWKHPTRSVPLVPKGESLLQENRKAGSGSVRSASNSPRRPERYGSPRSVAMEQKLMKSALESDGYWIGDFRVPAPALPKRSTSTGASTSTKSTTKMTSAASFSSASTKSTPTTSSASTATPTYRRSNSHRV